MKLANKIICFVACATLSSLSFSETLLEIYEQALENDPQLRADKAAYEAGKENYKIARASFLPQLSGTVSYTDLDSETQEDGETVIGNVTFPNSDSTRTNETTSYALTLQQSIFNMSNWYGYKQGVTQTKQAEATFEKAQRSLIIRVSEAYLNILRAVETLETARAQETALESQLEQVQQRFEVGLTAITDVLDAQSSYDSALATLFEAEGNLAITFQQLEVLTGASPESLAPLVEDFNVSNPVPANSGDWIDFALENNSDLKIAKLDKEASGYGAKARKSEHLPTLRADVRYSSDDADSVYTNASGPNPSSSITDTTRIAITLDIPLYSGGRTSAQRRQAFQNYTRAEEQYNLSYRNTIQNTRSQYLRVTTNVATVSARRQAVISAESRLEATQAGYEVGTRNIVEVLSAQQSLFDAQRQYSNSLFDYILNNLLLKEAAGTLSPQDVIELNEFLDEQNQISREVIEAQNQ